MGYEKHLELEQLKQFTDKLNEYLVGRLEYKGELDMIPAGATARTDWEDLRPALIGDTYRLVGTEPMIVDNITYKPGDYIFVKNECYDNTQVAPVEVLLLGGSVLTDGKTIIENEDEEYADKTAIMTAIGGWKETAERELIAEGHCTVGAAINPVLHLSRELINAESIVIEVVNPDGTHSLYSGTFDLGTMQILAGAITGAVTGYSGTGDAGPVDWQVSLANSGTWQEGEALISIYVNTAGTNNESRHKIDGRYIPVDEISISHENDYIRAKSAIEITEFPVNPIDQQIYRLTADLTIGTTKYSAGLYVYAEDPDNPGTYIWLSVGGSPIDEKTIIKSDGTDWAEEGQLRTQVGGYKTETDLFFSLSGASAIADSEYKISYIVSVASLVPEGSKVKLKLLYPDITSNIYWGYYENNVARVYTSINGSPDVTVLIAYDQNTGVVNFTITNPDFSIGSAYRAELAFYSVDYTKSDARYINIDDVTTRLRSIVSPSFPETDDDAKLEAKSAIEITTFPTGDDIHTEVLYRLTEDYTDPDGKKWLAGIYVYDTTDSANPVWLSVGGSTIDKKTIIFNTDEQYAELGSIMTQVGGWKELAYPGVASGGDTATIDLYELVTEIYTDAIEEDASVRIQYFIDDDEYELFGTMGDDNKILLGDYTAEQKYNAGADPGYFISFTKNDGSVICSTDSDWSISVGVDDESYIYHKSDPNYIKVDDVSTIIYKDEDDDDWLKARSAVEITEWPEEPKTEVIYRVISAFPDGSKIIQPGLYVYYDNDIGTGWLRVAQREIDNKTILENTDALYANEDALVTAVGGWKETYGYKTIMERKITNDDATVLSLSGFAISEDIADGDTIEIYVQFPDGTFVSEDCTYSEADGQAVGTTFTADMVRSASGNLWYSDMTTTWDAGEYIVRYSVEQAADIENIHKSDASFINIENITTRVDDYGRLEARSAVEVEELPDVASTKEQVIYHLMSVYTDGAGVVYQPGYYTAKYNTTTSVMDWTRVGGDVRNAYQDINKINDYLYGVYYDEEDYDYAEDYFYNNRSPFAPAGCTVGANGKYIIRNFDWTYSESVEFVVRTEGVPGHYATLGIAGHVNGLTKDFVASGDYSEKYKLVPFAIVDGINEKGLWVNTNIVNVTAGEEMTKTDGDYDIPSPMIPRYLLENFKTAEAAKDWFMDHAAVYNVKYMSDEDLEPHWFVKDETNCYVLEIVNNVKYATELTDHQAMSNFLVATTTFNTDGKVYTPNDVAAGHTPTTENSLRSNDIGLERYNFMIDNLPSATNLVDARLIANQLFYSNAYDGTRAAEDQYYSDFAGINSLTVDSPAADYEADVTVQLMRAAWPSRTRDGNFWQTCHSVVADIESLEYNVVSQENVLVEYTFGLMSAGSKTKIDNVSIVKNDNEELRAKSGIEITALPDSDHALTECIYRLTEEYTESGITYAAGLYVYDCTDPTNPVWRIFGKTDYDQKTIIANNDTSYAVEGALMTQVGGWRETVSEADVDLVDDTTPVVLADAEMTLQVPNIALELPKKNENCHIVLTFPDGTIVDETKAYNADTKTIDLTLYSCTYNATDNTWDFVDKLGNAFPAGSYTLEATDHSVEYTYHKSDAKYIDVDENTTLLDDDEKLRAKSAIEIATFPAEPLTETLYRLTEDITVGTDKYLAGIYVYDTTDPDNPVWLSVGGSHIDEKTIIANTDEDYASLGAFMTQVGGWKQTETGRELFNGNRTVAGATTEYLTCNVAEPFKVASTVDLEVTKPDGTIVTDSVTILTIEPGTYNQGANLWVAVDSATALRVTFDHAVDPTYLDTGVYSVKINETYQYPEVTFHKSDARYIRVDDYTTLLVSENESDPYADEYAMLAAKSALEIETFPAAPRSEVMYRLLEDITIDDVKYFAGLYVYDITDVDNPHWVSVGGSRVDEKTLLVNQDATFADVGTFTTAIGGWKETHNEDIRYNDSRTYSLPTANVEFPYDQPLMTGSDVHVVITGGDIDVDEYFTFLGGSYTAYLGDYIFQSTGTVASVTHSDLSDIAADTYTCTATETYATPQDFIHKSEARYINTDEYTIVLQSETEDDPLQDPEATIRAKSAIEITEFPDDALTETLYRLTQDTVWGGISYRAGIYAYDLSDPTNPQWLSLGGSEIDDKTIIHNTDLTHADSGVLRTQIGGWREVTATTTSDAVLPNSTYVIPSGAEDEIYFNATAAVMQKNDFINLKLTYPDGTEYVETATYTKNNDAESTTFKIAYDATNLRYTITQLDGTAFSLGTYILTMSFTHDDIIYHKVDNNYIDIDEQTVVLNEDDQIRANTIILITDALMPAEGIENAMYYLAEDKQDAAGNWYNVGCYRWIQDDETTGHFELISKLAMVELGLEGVLPTNPDNLALYKRELDVYVLISRYEMTPEATAAGWYPADEGLYDPDEGAFIAWDKVSDEWETYVAYMQQNPSSGDIYRYTYNGDYGASFKEPDHPLKIELLIHDRDLGWFVIWDNVGETSARGSYNDLSSKPQINGVTLISNQNSEQIKVAWFGTQAEYEAIADPYPYTIYITDNELDQTYQEYSVLHNKPQVNHVELEGDKSSSELNIIWSGTQVQYDALTEHNPDTVYYIIDDNEAVTETNYDALSNLPQINSVTLTGNKKLEEFNLYSMDEVDTLIANSRNIVVQETLPATPVKNTLYYIGPQADGTYDLYLYDSEMQQIYLGNTTFDFSAYQKKIDASLITPETSIVGAINGRYTDIGDKTALPTLAKTDLVSSITELYNNVGNLATLNTTIKTSTVRAINEVNAHVGDITLLETTQKASAVAAINEVFTLAGTVFTGADGINAGEKGLVPAPAALDAYGVLCGDGTWKPYTDSGAPSSIDQSQSLVTERDVYFGLPFINGVHNYNANTSYYGLATTIGNNGQILVSNGDGTSSWKTYVLVEQPGTAGQILVSNGDGTAHWADP